MKNDGEYPLPSKVGGEGGLAAANTEGNTVGSNGQGPAPSAEVKAPMPLPAGTSGQGKQTNPVPVNQSGSK